MATNDSSLGTFGLIIDIILFLEAIMMITINSLLLLVIWKLRKKRTVTHHLIFCLTISDLMLGVSLLVTRTLAFAADDIQAEGQATRWAMLVTLSLYFSSPACSCFSHLGIAADRWVAVVYPNQYKTKMTKKRVWIYIGISWSYCIVVMSICVVYSGLQLQDENLVTLHLTNILPVHIWYGVLVPTLGILLLLTNGLYMKVFWSIRQHQKKVSQVNGAGDGSWNKKAVSVTKLMAALLAIYIFCWGPYSVIASTLVIAGHSHQWLEICYRLSTVILFSNSYLNSMVYMYKSTEMRKALGQLLQCKVRHRNGSDSRVISVTEGTDAF